MAKFNIIELNIKNGVIVDFDEKSETEQKVLRSQNVIYIYHGTLSEKIYIGQTTNFEKRHKQHYSKSQNAFNIDDFDQVIVVFSRFFNKSALDDVESQLITYFEADRKNKRKKIVSFENNGILNRNSGNSVNDYIGRENIPTDIILPLWENILYPKGWVSTKTLEKLRADALVKYSPLKKLSDEQEDLISEIIEHPSKNYVINGDAGTGKTVLLTHLAAKVLQKRPDAKVGVVVQPNWEQIGLNIFKVFGMNNSRLSVLTSTKLIMTQEKYDIIIVDESHKLSRKYGKQHPSFHAVYKISAFSDCESHLEILQKLGNQIILMYDVLQAIRPAHITRDMFQKLTTGYEKRFLTTQFRIDIKKKPYTSEDYINGIKYLLYKDTGLLDSPYTNYKPNFNRELFRDKSDDAYFGYVKDQPLHRLSDWIDDDRNSKPEHINRILAGLVEKWKQSDGKDSSITHWHEGDLNLRWNSKQENWIISNEKDASEQVGSVFAVQGIDLNKVGVLIGADIQVNEDGKLVANPANFHNTNGKFTAEEMEIKENQFEFTLFVLNIYYVLLTRGIDGIRIGFWNNDSFRQYMERTLEIT